MKLLQNSERLRILISLSDQLWNDYKSGELTPDQYLIKSEKIREEINKVDMCTFYDLQCISSNIGYLLIKKNNAFSTLKSFKIARN